MPLNPTFVHDNCDMAVRLKRCVNSWTIASHWIIIRLEGWSQKQPRHER